MSPQIGWSKKPNKIFTKVGKEKKGKEKERERKEEQTKRKLKRNTRKRSLPSLIRILSILSNAGYIDSYYSYKRELVCILRLYLMSYYFFTYKEF